MPLHNVYHTVTYMRVACFLCAFLIAGVTGQLGGGTRYPEGLRGTGRVVPTRLTDMTARTEGVVLGSKDSENRPDSRHKRGGSAG